MLNFIKEKYKRYKNKQRIERIKTLRYRVNLLEKTVLPNLKNKGGVIDFNMYLPIVWQNDIVDLLKLKFKATKNLIEDIENDGNYPKNLMDTYDYLVEQLGYLESLLIINKAVRSYLPDKFSCQLSGYVILDAYEMFNKKLEEIKKELEVLYG